MRPTKDNDRITQLSDQLGISPGSRNLRRVGRDAYHMRHEITDSRFERDLFDITIVNQNPVTALFRRGCQVGQRQRRRGPRINGQF